MPLKIITTRKGALFGAQRIITARFLESELECNAGPEPVWYGHCVYLSVNKLEGSAWGGMLPPGKIFKIRNSEIASEASLGQNATRISPPVVSVGSDSEVIEPSFQK